MQYNLNTIKIPTSISYYSKTYFVSSTILNKQIFDKNIIKITNIYYQSKSIGTCFIVKT